MIKKVLIIEDDRNLAESLKSLLTRKKMEVNISYSGGQAEHLISLEQYDLLIIDLILPKMNGIDLVRQIVSKKLLHSHCKIWIISGVLKKNIISTDILGHIDEFIEKPLNPRIIEKKIEALSTHSNDRLKNVQLFYLNWSNQPGNFLKNQTYIIKGHELMFTCFYLYSLRFNGMLSVHYQNQKDEVLFYDGKLNSFKTNDKTSYLGSLLIKNNLVSKEDIEKLLNQKTHQPLGDKLVNDCYLSPHQLNKILKEQLAIRLFKTMNQDSIMVSCQDFQVSRRFNQFAELNMKNYLSLINNWIHSKVTVKWLKGFFKSCEDLYLVSSKSVIPHDQLTHYSKLDFLSQPATQSAQTPLSIADFLVSREETKGLRELYCRLLIRELVIEDTVNKSPAKSNYEFMKKKYTTFLADAHKKNYFELMNLPINAPVQKIEEIYTNMVKIFHPDRRSQGMPRELMEICDQCFMLVRKIYQTLSNPDKRKAYIKKIGEDSNRPDFSIKEIYMKARKNLTEGHYEKAFNQFESIFKNKLAPGDTILYYISAKLKNMKSPPSTKEKEQIAQLFERVSFDHKQSALFYFSRGLFKKAEGDIKSAFDFFTKATLLDPTFTIARVERHNLSQAKKKKKAPSSLLKFFKKGA